MHELTVDIEFQVILQKRRIQCNAGRCTLEFRTFEDTLLIGIACTKAVGHILQTTGNSDIVINTDTALEDLVLPVGIGIAQQSSCFRVCTVVIPDEVAILVGTQHVEGLLLHRIRHITIVADMWLLVGAALLGRDDDDTVRTAATINSSS